MADPIEQLDGIYDVIQSAREMRREVGSVRVSFLPPEGTMVAVGQDLVVHLNDWNRMVAAVAAVTKPSVLLEERVWGIPVIKEHAVLVWEKAQGWVNEACRRWYEEQGAP